jgi:hypothetical protein
VENVFQEIGPHYQAGAAILISETLDFWLKSIRSDNVHHFILNKGTIYQEEISIVNIYVPNTGAPIYDKKTLMAFRAQIDPNKMIVGDLNTPLSSIDKSSRQNSAKKLQRDLTH